MQKIFVVLLFVIVISSFSNVYAQEQTTQEPIILEQLSPSGQILVKLEWPEVYPDELYDFKVTFHDPETGDIRDDIRLNYKIYVTQHDHEVETYEYNDTRNGIAEHEVLFPEDSEGLAKVVVRLMASVDHDDGDVTVYHENVEFSVNVVPEFGVIAMIILSIAFVPILFLSKSKLMPKL